MTEQSYAWCKYFESTDCPYLGHQIMQKLFTPNSINKGNFSNIADDWNILDAIDMCANCNDFEHK